MKYELFTEIEINTQPEKVWDKLMDFESYPEWNPFIKSISGEQEVDGRLKVSLTPIDGRGMTVKPRVTSMVPNERFSWLGKLLVTGLFDGEHIFELHKIDDSKTRFVHKENFKGISVRFFRKMIDGSTKKSFKAINEALKQELEK